MKNTLRCSKTYIKFSSSVVHIEKSSLTWGEKKKNTF